MPLLWACESATRPRRGALTGFLFGLGFFGTLIVWVSLVGWVAWGGAVIIESAFLAAFGATWAYLSPRMSGVAYVASAGAAWVAFEYLRSLVPWGGFTWGQLAQSQHNLAWILKVAGIGGSLAVAFLIVAVNASLLLAIRAAVERDRRGAVIFAAAAVALIAAPILLPSNVAGGPPIDVAIVQGNVPRHLPAGRAKQLAITGSHAQLTAGLAGDGVDLVVWPESSVGVDPENNLEFGTLISDAARAAGAPMIVGTNFDGDADTYIVAAIHVDETGETVERYQKTHLVPFGEYVPGRDLLDWIPMLDQIPTDAVPGDKGAVFDVAGGRVAPVISYEGDFGSLVRGRIEDGGRLLVVATNTSTWGESWASAQHVAHSQVRAAENGVWVAHAALSGISAFIAPDGTVQATLPLWQAGTLTREVAFAESITLYARWGDFVAWLSLLGVAFTMWLVRRRPSSEDEQDSAAD